MRRLQRGHAVMVGAVVAVAGLLPGGVTGAEPASEACRAALLSLAVEQVPLPDGLEWQTLRPAWSGTVAASGAPMDMTRWIDVSLGCDPQAERTFQRAAEVRAALGLEETLAARPIGDESAALRWTEGPMTGIRVEWRQGPFVGSVANRFLTMGGQTAPFGDLEALASTLDALMRSALAVTEPGASPSPGQEPSNAAGRVIELELTAALQIVDPGGDPVRSIAVTPGETVEFRLLNTAGYSHSFWIGTDAQLAASQTDGLPGVPDWSDAEPRTFTWTVPADVTGLRFGCTVPGHYSLMQGDLTVARPAAVAQPVRPRLTMSRNEIRLAALPATVEVRFELQDANGRPVDGAPTVFSLSVPGQPTEVFQTTLVDGVARWSVSVPRERAERGAGFVTASADLGSGVEPATLTQTFVIR